ncbi:MULTISPECIES: tyrosine-type recombinase/integrase [unclassified Campylobacter]|uniref:tyrosine-type recombinase/integrase n=1 Tax=unclassified Campylobacter TaxID=2593542 RepID=UPI001D2E5ABC|nr:tyrosine-type recombinase/integrase [Campylobacter sp. RM9331]MBZ8005158.1 tyrosine-type recombinase/integrase [Campylobacter sp. RM9332]
MLTDSEIIKLKPNDKVYMKKVVDNLYICITPKGKKSFVLITFINKKRVKKTLGEFSSSFRIRNAIMQIDSTQEKIINDKNKIPFKQVCYDYMQTQEKQISDKQLHTYYSLLDRFILDKELSDKDIKEVSKADIIKRFGILKDKSSTAKKLLNLLKRIYSYACMLDYTDNHILFPIKLDMIVRYKPVENYPTITKGDDLEYLFTLIQKARPITKYALIFNALTALRPGNVRLLKWEYINDDILEIPAEQMKRKKPFYLPLSTQAKRVLEIMKTMKNSDYVFYSEKQQNQGISDNTMRSFLRKNGITNDEFTPHGFRAMFSTIANDNNYSSEIIELCLAHTVGGVRGVYDRSHKLEAKRELMQWWGDYLEKFIKDFL